MESTTKTTTRVINMQDEVHTVRKVVEITDTPIQTVSGRKLIRRVEKILMPNGRYRYPVTYIDMSPGFVRGSEIWKNEKRAPGYKINISLNS